VVEFPSPGWYNYWTGERIPLSVSATATIPDPLAVPDRDTQFSIRVAPELSQLPVFVRAGSILPISPVVKSTGETPQGPLTLRVYPGDGCSGELYQDDGKTYAFQRGVYLRMKFSCNRTAEGMRLDISSHEGSYPAWWKQVHVEIFGLTPKQSELHVNGKKISAAMDGNPQSTGFTVEDDGKGEVIEIQ
jgi:alpha-glucosidase